MTVQKSSLLFDEICKTVNLKNLKSMPILHDVVVILYSSLKFNFIQINLDSTSILKLFYRFQLKVFYYKDINYYNSSHLKNKLRFGSYFISRNKIPLGMGK